MCQMLQNVNFVSKFLFQDCLKTCFFQLVVCMLITLLPCMLYKDQTIKFSSSSYSLDFRSNDYQHWLITTTIVCIPLLVEVLLERRKSKVKNRFDYQLWFIFFLAVPNLILHIVNATSDDGTDFIFFAKFQKAVVFIQTLVLSCSFFCSMFDNSIPIVSHNEKLEMPLEKLTVSMIFLFIGFQSFSFICSLDSISTSNSLSKVFEIIAAIFLIFGLLNFVFVSVKLIIFFRRQRNGNLDFKCSKHMSLYYRTLAISLFLLYSILLYFIAGGITNNTAPQSFSSDFLISYSCGQIALIFCWGIIDGQSNRREAEIQMEKLEIRLNLVRYISHEMRTPLNTSFMGLQLIHKDANHIKEKTKKLLGIGKHKQIEVALAAAANVMTTTKEESDQVHCSNNSGNDVEISRAAIFDCRQMVDQILETTGLIEEATNVAVQTLDDMLTFDKIDEHKLVVELSEVNPVSLVKEALKPFELRARAQNISVSLECIGGENTERCSIKADRFKLSQVLRNLLSNACKFVPENNGTIHVVVETIHHNKHNNSNRNRSGASAFEGSVAMVRISVKDNGCGISKANQSRMFGQYVQFNAGELQQGKGSGLGLWISKSLIELHGGYIGVDSAGEGHGCTFFFELPLFTNHSQPSHHHTHHSSINNISQTHHHHHLRRNNNSITSNQSHQRSNHPSFGSLSNSIVLQVDHDNDLEAPDPLPADLEPAIMTNTTVSNMEIHGEISNTDDAAVVFTETTKPVHHNHSPGTSPTTPASTFTSRRIVPFMQSSHNFDYDSTIDEENPSQDDGIHNSINNNNTIITTVNSTPKKPSILSHIFNSYSNGPPPTSLPRNKRQVGFLKKSVVFQEIGMFTTDHNLNNISSSNLINDNENYDNNSKGDEPIEESVWLRDSLSSGGVKSVQNSFSRRASDDYMRYDSVANERKMRIMIVDDTATNRKVTRNLITRLGHVVDEAVDGQDFLHKMGVTDDVNSYNNDDSIIPFPIYDVILMDDNMPHMCGPAAVSIIRKLGYTGLIFGVTGNTDSSDVENFIQKGANRVFSKPLDLNFLSFCANHEK